MGAALLIALPHALAGGIGARDLCASLLAGLLTCFVTEKCARLSQPIHSPANAIAGTALAALCVLGVAAWCLSVSHALVFASAAVLYLALSRLLPLLLREDSPRGAALQLLLVGAGIGLSLLLPKAGGGG